MAKGDVTILGPYAPSATSTMDTQITAAVNGKLCVITSWSTANGQQVYFAVVLNEA